MLFFLSRVGRHDRKAVRKTRAGEDGNSLRRRGVAQAKNRYSLYQLVNSRTKRSRSERAPAETTEFEPTTKHFLITVVNVVCEYVFKRIEIHSGSKNKTTVANRIQLNKKQ